MCYREYNVMFTGCSRSFHRSYLRWSLNCEVGKEGGGGGGN